jgi:excisionase family DNA binding protein
MLVGPDGENTPLPGSAFQALAIVVEAMSRGQAITLVPVGQELTTQQAAEILHVSRPHLTKLLEAGEIPFHKVGTHRRIAIEDILAYRERRAAQRADALRELGDLSQELGGYRQT